MIDLGTLHTEATGAHKGSLPETKVATLAGVREYSEGDPVELWVNAAGRLIVRAYNECGYSFTDVDLLDLLAWAKTGKPENDGGEE